MAPDVPEIHNNLGVIYARQGAYDRAVAAFERALALEPGNAVAERNLAFSLQALTATTRRCSTIRPRWPWATSRPAPRPTWPSPITNRTDGTGRRRRPPGHRRRRQGRAGLGLCRVAQWRWTRTRQKPPCRRSTAHWSWTPTIARPTFPGPGLQGVEPACRGHGCLRAGLDDRSGRGDAGPDPPSLGRADRRAVTMRPVFRYPFRSGKENHRPPMPLWRRKEVI